MTKNKEKTKKPSISSEEYRKILKGLNLDDISMCSSKTSIDREQINPNISISVKDDASYKEIEDNCIEVRHEYKLAAKALGQRKIALKIECVFSLIYSSEEKFSEEFFEIFKDLNLPINSWPFFREFVYSTTSRMNVPPLTVPLYIHR